MKYPGLLTVTKDINAPRLPSFKNKMAAKKAEIPVWGVEELKAHLDESTVGIKGSPTWVKRVEVPAAIKREGKQWRDNLDQAIEEFTDILVDHKILEVN